MNDLVKVLLGVSLLLVSAILHGYAILHDLLVLEFHCSRMEKRWNFSSGKIFGARRRALMRLLLSQGSF